MSLASSKFGRLLPQSLRWLTATLVFLALVLVARFVLEVVGVPSGVAHFISGTAALCLAAVYLGAVAPLRGVQKVSQLILPAALLAFWTQGWVILATFVSGALRLERSHFAGPEDYGNWANLGKHMVAHLAAAIVFTLVILILMASTYCLRRWPITVGPAAVLGGLVIIRFWVEAMGVTSFRAAGWSSSVALLISGFYLGGLGSRFGLHAARRLLVPALVLGWMWRYWVFLATLFGAAIPFYKTHFFDPAGGQVALRLAKFLGASIIEGSIAGLLVWGIAAWISCATRETEGGNSPAA
jgi:hypothetical protein